MKLRPYLLTLVMLFTSFAWADWVMLAKGTNGTQLYVDLQTVKKDGNFRKFWQLTNLTSRGVAGEMSRKSRVEIDCKEERVRALVVTEYSKPMADGVPLGESSF